MYKNILKNILKKIKTYKLINFIKVYNSIFLIKLVFSNYKIIRSAYKAKKYINTLLVL